MNESEPFRANSLALPPWESEENPCRVPRRPHLPIDWQDQNAVPIRPKRKRILLADDDAAVRHSLAAVLESENYEVVTADDGTEAVEKFVRLSPDLVLLDLNMPGKNGWEVFNAIDEFQPLLPVIVITARPNQYPRAVGAGIDALMEKPLDLPVLLQTIESLLREPRSKRITRLVARDFATIYLQPLQQPSNL